METSLDMIKSLPDFLQSAWDKLGFAEMTPIQKKAIPLIQNGLDIIAESPTGTGKTYAYLLPVLEKIDISNKNPQAVIVAPTRELVMQIEQEIKKLTTGSEIQSASLIGGADIKRQVEKLKTSPRIIVGTPGRIIELNQMKKLKMHEVKTIIVDEVDQMLSLGFMDIVQNVIKTTQRDRQLLFFSATVPPKVVDIAKSWMRNPEVIRVSKGELAPSKTEHIYFICEKRERMDIVRRLIRMNENMKALAFVGEGENIGPVSAKLEYMGIKNGVLEGLSHKTEREAVLKNFREGRLSLLLATDIAARGLDIEGLTHVIHFDLPDRVEQYIHRSGRTGRMGAEGTVIALITNFEEAKLQSFAKELKIEVHKKVLYEGKIQDAKTFSSTKAPKSKFKQTGKSVGTKTIRKK